MAMQGMSVRKTDDFIADVERQFEWYAVNGGREVSERYLAAVEATCRLLGQPRSSRWKRPWFAHTYESSRFDLVGRPGHSSRVPPSTSVLRRLCG